MRFQGAVIREQGLTFAVVVVKKQVVDFRDQANQALGTFQSAVPGMPIVLMAQDSRGRATYYGRQDISKYLASVPVHAIPWREYTLH